MRTALPWRVLVVEDDPDHAWILKALLAAIGCVVLLAADLASARAVLAAQALDVVLLDVVLPDGDGLALCRAIKGERPETPVVVLTAGATPAGHADAISAGADLFLSKPFDPEEVGRVVRDLLSRAPGGGPRASADRA